MALSNIKSASAATAPSAVRRTVDVDVSEFVPGDGPAVVTFQEPRTSDIFPSSAIKSAISDEHPSFSETLVTQICIMGRCYVPDAQDREEKIVPAEILAELAESHTPLFLHLVTQFNVAFPDAFGKARLDVKNDSAQ